MKFYKIQKSLINLEHVQSIVKFENIMGKDFEDDNNQPKVEFVIQISFSLKNWQDYIFYDEKTRDMEFEHLEMLLVKEY